MPAELHLLLEGQGEPHFVQRYFALRAFRCRLRFVREPN
jgi:hypothetical protein